MICRFPEMMRKKGHLVVAFFLLFALPLLRLNSYPFFDLRIYLIFLVLALFFIIRAVRLFSVKVPGALSYSILDILFAAYYLVYMLSCLFSSHPELSFTALLNEIPFMMAYAFFRSFSDGSTENAGYSYLSGIVMLTAVTLSLWGLSQFFFEIDVSPGLRSLFKTHHFPIIASLGNPNFLGEFLVLSLPFVLSIVIRRRLVLLLMIILIGIAVFLTYSRLAWVVLVLFMIVSVKMAPPSMRKRLVTVYLLLVIGSCSLFAYHKATDSPPSRRIIQGLKQMKNPLAEREIMYRAGLTLFCDSSPLGFGPGAFGYRYLRYQQRAVNEGAGNRIPLIDLDHAHSDFIEIGVDSGYVALLLYVLLFGYALYAGFRDVGEEDSQRFINVIPLLYLPFGLLAFPQYLPFSKLLFYLSLARISGSLRHRQLRIDHPRLIALLALMVIISFAWFHSRYAFSLFQHRRGLANFSVEEGGFNEFCRGIQSYPYNGYNYFSAGALLLNEQQGMGITYLKNSLRYLNITRTYLYLARGYRDQYRYRTAIHWYEELLALRPDLLSVRKEYEELLDMLREESPDKVPE
jgi:O-antigen ligase